MSRYSSSLRFVFTIAIAFGLIASSEVAFAQSQQGTISIYTYRTVTNRLTNENERLSGLAISERKRAVTADKKWLTAQRQLNLANKSNQLSKRQVRELKKAAQARASEFEAAINDLNAKLASQDEEFQRTLRAATAAGNDLLISDEGQRALALIALGGEENTEAGIQILLAEQEVQDKVDKLRIADRARSIGVTLLGVRGTAPSATTTAIIKQYELVTANDPSKHWDWIILTRLYRDADRLDDANQTVAQASKLAANENAKIATLAELANIQFAQGDEEAALRSRQTNLDRREAAFKRNTQSRFAAYSLATSLTGIGSVQLESRSYEAAEKSYERCLTVLEGFDFGVETGSRDWYLQSACLDGLGGVKQELGKLPDALALFRRANSIDELALSADPDSQFAQLSMATGLSRVARVQLAQRDVQPALANFLKAHAIFEQLVESDPDSAVALSKLSWSFTNICDVHELLGNIDAQLDSCRKALTLSEELFEKTPSSISRLHNVTSQLKRISRYERNAKQYEAALGSLARARELEQLWLTIAPNSLHAQRDLALTLESVGSIHFKENNFLAALENYEISLGMREKIAELNSASFEARRDLLLANENIADSYEKMDKYKDALQSRTRHLLIAEQQVEQSPSSVLAQLDLARTLYKMAINYHLRGKSKEAETFAVRGISIQEELRLDGRLAVSGERFLSVQLNVLGDIRFALERFDASYSSYERSLLMREKRLTASIASSLQAQEDIAYSLTKLGKVRVAQGRNDDAIAYFTRRLDIRRELAKADPNSLSKIEMSDNGPVSAALWDLAELNHPDFTWSIVVAQLEKELEAKEVLAPKDKEKLETARDRASEQSKGSVDEQLVNETVQ